MKGEKYDTIISFLEGRSLVYHSFILKQGIRHLSWVHVDLLISIGQKGISKVISMRRNVMN